MGWNPARIFRSLDVQRTCRLLLRLHFPNVHPCHRWLPPKSPAPPSRSHGLFEPLPARIGCVDDGANRFLVEPLKPSMTLQIFQMAANRAVANEFSTLFARDQS